MSNAAEIVTRMKPHDWTWQDWIDTIRNSSIIPVEVTDTLSVKYAEFLQELVTNNPDITVEELETSLNVFDALTDKPVTRTPLHDFIKAQPSTPLLPDEMFVKWKIRG